MLQFRKPNRLTGYDYTTDNLYFITICVHNKICCLGNIINGAMQLNAYGKIAEQQWFWLAEQYSYITLHAFVVMPNHVHGIIEINRDNIREMGNTGDTKIKSLSEIVGAYKTTVSKKIHHAGLPDFQWQRSFYDNIIRDHIAHYNITRYIETNPEQWSEDRFYL
jgi:REP element-mobilizing transposase RayT